MIIESGGIFIINEYIIATIFIYFLAGKKRNKGELLREIILIMPIAYLGKKIPVFLYFGTRIVTGQNIEIYWLYLFFMLFIYVKYFIKAGKIFF